ncbi:hypothetical protein NFI96_007561, partial [Prochilodus magdalenae]
MEPRVSGPAANRMVLFMFAVWTTTGLFPAAAIRVYTPDEMFVENGTTGTLKCSFKSTQVISSQASVSWSFTPEGSPDSTGVAIFYYAGGKAFPDSPQFKQRVEWAGDLNKKDASIRVTHMQFLDNGTYSCDVKNPPDIRGNPSLTKLSVVMKGLFPAAAIEVYTPDEVFVENGTTGMLKCSFKSTQVISSQASVSWSYTPEGSPDSTGVAIFYYAGGKAFPDSPQFKQRVEWAGDLNKKDASIRVTHMQFLDNGTYSCDVKNPPDISGKPSLTKLSVVMKEALPQTSPAVIVGAVIGAIIGVIIIAFVAYLLIRLIPSSHDYE